MAKYEVKMSCGHTETIQLFGKMTDREKRIAWLEEHGTCSACYKAHKDAAHAEETAAAKAKADEENLPNLTGSEKQINWALAIRAKKFEALDNRLAEMNAKVADEQQQRKNQIACQATRNVLASKTDSRFWIDNRNVDALRLIANNNLQDELKAEFARLTAEADTKETTTETTTENEEEHKMTIETKIAKNGATLYYVDGKRVSREKAKLIRNEQINATNAADYAKLEGLFGEVDPAKEETHALVALNVVPQIEGDIATYRRRKSIDEALAIAAEACKIFGDRLKGQVLKVNPDNHNDSEVVAVIEHGILTKFTMTKFTNNNKIAAIEAEIQSVIAERTDAYDELFAAKANDEISQETIDRINEDIEDLSGQYWQLVDELEAAKAEPDDEPPTPETDGSEDDDAPEYVEPELGTTGGFPDIYEVTEYADNGYRKLYNTFDNLRDAFTFANDSPFPADVTIIQGDRCYFICDDTGEYVTNNKKFSTAIHALIEQRDTDVFDLLPEIAELNDVDEDDEQAKTA